MTPKTLQNLTLQERPLLIDPCRQSEGHARYAKGRLPLIASYGLTWLDCEAETGQRLALILTDSLAAEPLLVAEPGAGSTLLSFRPPGPGLEDLLAGGREPSFRLEGDPRLHRIADAGYALTGALDLENLVRFSLFYRALPTANDIEVWMPAVWRFDIRSAVLPPRAQERQAAYVAKGVAPIPPADGSGGAASTISL